MESTSKLAAAGSMLESWEVSRVTLGCGKRDVTGEDTVHIWQCLPVILVISRWDVLNDSLDVTLSNNISFPQVQRAVAFWQQNAAVPYTCGYTVGYETLKTIVAHWLTGTPVTESIVGAKLATTLHERISRIVRVVLPDEG